jgi:hypothetical protein
MSQEDFKVIYDPQEIEDFLRPQGSSYSINFVSQATSAINISVFSPDGTMYPHASLENCEDEIPVLGCRLDSAWAIEDMNNEDQPIMAIIKSRKNIQVTISDEYPYINVENWDIREN